MLQRGLVHRRKPIGRGKRAGAYAIRRHLRRHGVQHVECALDNLRTVRALVLEARHAGFAIHLHQPGFEIKLDVIALDILHQRRHISGHTEQHRPGEVELNGNRLEISGPQPAVAA